MSELHILDDRAIKNLKRLARKIKIERNIAQSQAQNIVANRIGFGSWKELDNTYKLEKAHGGRFAHQGYIPTENYNPAFLELEIANTGRKITESFTYTQDQKIGAVCRHLGIQPANLKNTIQFCIEYSDYDTRIDKPLSVLEYHGICEDLELPIYLAEHDPWFKLENYFEEVLFFRLLSIDTDSHDAALRYIENELSRKLELFFDIRPEWIWINGKLPTHTEPPWLEEYGDDTCPLLELPSEAWRRYGQPWEHNKP